jgi:hypothetical protein
MRTVKHPKNKENLEFCLQNLLCGKLTLKQAAKISGYNPSYLSVKKKEYKQKGSKALVNGHTGMKSKNKVPADVKKKIELCIYKNGMKALVDGVYYPVTLRGTLQDGIDETMSQSLKNIIYDYMLTDCKKTCA